MNVRFESTFKVGTHPDNIEIAHKIVMLMVGLAILKVDNMQIKPGMPGYGQALHRALTDEIMARGNPNFQANPIYLNQNKIGTLRIPAGASVPDVAYGFPGEPPLVVWTLKPVALWIPLTQR